VKGKRKPVLIAASVIGAAWIAWAGFSPSGQPVAGSWVASEVIYERPFGNQIWLAKLPKRLVFRNDGTYQWEHPSFPVARGTWRRVPSSGAALPFPGDDFPPVEYQCEENGKTIAWVSCTNRRLTLTYAEGTSPAAFDFYSRPGPHSIPAHVWYWIERTLLP